MVSQKNKGGAGKFFLGALLGGIGGAIAGRFIHKNEDKIKEAVEDKLDDFAEGIAGCKAEADKSKVVSDEPKAEESKKAGAKKVEKTAKHD